MRPHGTRLAALDAPSQPPLALGAMVDAELLEILVCPEDKTPVTLASAETLALLNATIAGRRGQDPRWRRGHRGRDRRPRARRRQVPLPRPRRHPGDAHRRGHRARMNRRHFVRAAAGVGSAALTGLAPAAAAQPAAAATAGPDRAEPGSRASNGSSAPVVRALAAGRLRATMPIESSGTGRAEVTHLEAVGRTLMGLAPWLALPPSTDAEGSGAGGDGRARARRTRAGRPSRWARPPELRQGVAAAGGRGVPRPGVPARAVAVGRRCPRPRAPG